MNHRWIATGDVNDDGFIDVAVAFAVTDQVTWFRNIGGEGSFSAGTDIDPSAEARFVELADVDGDGDLDAVCASKTDGKRSAPTIIPYIYTSCMRELIRPHPQRFSRRIDIMMSG